MSAPIELIALVQLEALEIITARRRGDPSFVHVQDLADAMQAALALGVDLVLPASLIAELGDDALPSTLPPWIRVVDG